MRAPPRRSVFHCTTLVIVFGIATMSYWRSFRNVDIVLFASFDRMSRMVPDILPLAMDSSTVKATTNCESMTFFILDPITTTSSIVFASSNIDNSSSTATASEIYSTSLSEESAEIWLHRGFQHHQKLRSCHTSDQNKAEVFVIPSYLHLRKKVQDATNHSFAGDVSGMIINASKPHLLLTPSWNPDVSRKIGIKALTQELLSAGVNLWSVGFERNSMWQHLTPERIIPIPYVVRQPASNANVETVTHVEYRSSLPREVDSVFYVGDPRKNAKAWAGCHRDELILPLQEKNISNIFVRLVGKRNRISESTYTAKMSMSEYCLILCGDTPSSRSLTSAMVSGCIPLRVGSRLRGLCEAPCHEGFGWKPTGLNNPHLPFTDDIPWETFPEVHESAFMNSSYETLQDVFQSYRTKKTELQAIMRKVQEGWVYGRGDPVSSSEFGDAVLYIWRSFTATLQEEFR